VLADGGVGAGGVVALLLHNCIEFVEALLACHRLGASVVPINFRLAPDEIDFILVDSGAVAVISDSPPPGPGPVRLVLEIGPAYDDAVASARPLREPAHVAEDDAALICYTSGTTGRPKGAVLTHRNLAASTLSWIHEMRAGEDDVWLSGQPLFHIGGINGLLPFLVLVSRGPPRPSSECCPATPPGRRWSGSRSESRRPTGSESRAGIDALTRAGGGVRHPLT
jgi:fatty-acyl-CoA synthase